MAPALLLTKYGEVMSNYIPNLKLQKKTKSKGLHIITSREKLMPVIVFNPNTHDLSCWCYEWFYLEMT